MTERLSIIAPLYGADSTAGVVDGCVTPAVFTSLEDEYRQIRQGIGLIDYSHYGKFMISGPQALELVNQINFADAERLPINQMLASFVLNDDGSPFCDLYVVNFGDTFLLLSEGATPAALLEVLTGEAAAGGYQATVEDLTAERCLFGLDGPYAWELLKEIMGVGVIGTRYLEVVPDNSLDGIPFHLYRAGKTGEFGYLLELAADPGLAVWKGLLARGERFELRPVGSAAIELCKLENRFVNMHREGRLAGNVLELNTRVMISPDKPSYRGSAGIEQALQKGIDRRLVGWVLKGDGPSSAGQAAVRQPISTGGEPIGEVANLGYSPTLGKTIGVGLIDTDYAYVGLDYQIDSPAGAVPIRTVSAPFILNASLKVRPQEHSYFDRS